MAIDQQISSRPATDADLLEFVNRELAPLARKTRDVVVSRVGLSIRIAADYAINKFDETILVDTTGGSVELDIPPADLWTRELTIIKDSGGPNVVNIVPFGDETISGSSPLTITTIYQGYRIRPILGVWYVVGVIA